MDLATLDLVDLDRFARGFPHDVFTLLRAHAPVWWHPPHPKAPGGEGFWVVSRHAETLHVLRDPNPHLAFGHGVHHCLGASLARTEIAVVLEALLERWSDVALDGDVEWARSNKHTGMRHLPVRFRTQGQAQREL